MKPKLRFQGFHDNWAEKKLGEVVTQIKNKNKELISDNVLTISAQYGLISQSLFFNKNVASKDLSGYYLLSKHDFAYNKSYSKGYAFGAIKRLSKYEQGIVSPLYICFKVKYGTDNLFLEQYFESQNWNRYINGVAQEGARNHGLLNIVIKDFFDMPLSLPSLPEQEKIGAFLSQLDDRIEKQEQKIELLKERKKGWMQQLFSQTIRFKDENGQDYPAWEDKKLGEVLEEQYKGKKSKESENGNLLLTTDYLDNREYSYVDELNNVNSKDILILWDGSQAGKVYTGYEGVLGSTFMKVSTYDYIASNYIYHFLNYNKKLIQEKWRTGSGIPHVSKDFISSFLISLPSLPEQEKIAEFLSKQDELIEKEEEKLLLLKAQKKGFLQQMFV